MVGILLELCFGVFLVLFVADGALECTLDTAAEIDRSFLTTDCLFVAVYVFPFETVDLIPVVPVLEFPAPEAVLVLKNFSSS